MNIFKSIDAELSTSVGTGDAPYSDDEMRRLAELRATPAYKRYAEGYAQEIYHLSRPEFRGF